MSEAVEIADPSASDPKLLQRAANLIEDAARALEATVEVSAAEEVTPEVWDVADRALRAHGLAFGPIFQQDLSSVGVPRVQQMRDVAAGLSRNAADLERALQVQRLPVQLRAAAVSLTAVIDRIARHAPIVHIPPRPGDDDLVLADARALLEQAARRIEAQLEEVSSLQCLLQQVTVGCARLNGFLHENADGRAGDEVGRDVHDIAQERIRKLGQDLVVEREVIRTRLGAPNAISPDPHWPTQHAEIVAALRHSKTRLVPELDLRGIVDWCAGRPDAAWALVRVAALLQLVGMARQKGPA